MHRIAQREKAFHATIRPNSNSESSTLRSETRWDEETMPRGALRLAGPLLAPPWDGTFAGALAAISAFPENVEDLLTIYRNIP
jgi:hypothetical protein